MITKLEDVLDEFINDNLLSTGLRNKNIHMSQIAMCGFKYRYEYDNDIKIDYSFNYEMGNAFEKIITYKLKKINPNIITQYEVKYKYEDLDIIGHTDAFDFRNNVIYELKSSFAYKTDYSDIYLRQLKAYMIANTVLYGKTMGILWIYKPLIRKFNEITVSEANNDDYNNFISNIVAFRENQYIDGIENSLCSLCKNVKCPMYERKKDYSKVF